MDETTAPKSAIGFLIGWSAEFSAAAAAWWTRQPRPNNSDENRSNRKDDNKVTPLDPPDMVHIKRRIGQKKNQIH